MATYKEIKGVTIQTLDSDPVEGGVGGGSWASGGTMNTSRKEAMGFGILTSNIMAGGNNPSPAVINSVEQYNGSSWTEITEINTARRNGRGGGTITAGIVFGGIASPGSGTGATETWNGSAWTEVNDMTRPGSQQSFGTAGASSTSALAFGGEPGTTYFAYTEKWDGSSWTEVNNLNTGRQGPAGFGIITAALCAGGYSPPAPPGNVVANVEKFDGTSWTEVNDINTARGSFAGSGSATAGLIFGGQAPPGKLAQTEAFDGTSFTEVGDLSKGIYEQGYAPLGASPQSNQAAISAGGKDANPGTIATTEEWTTAGPTSTILVEGDAFLGGGTTFKGVVKASSPATVWSSGGNTNTDRAYGHCFGPQTAAQMAAGEAPPRVTVSEQYDGTSWTEVNDTNHAGGVQARAGSGTQAAATIAAFAGASTPYGHAETWNGTSWSETAELNTAKYSRASTLTSGPAALVFGGTSPPDGATANTESFNGTAWSEVNNLNAPNYSASGVGSPTAGMNINGYTGSGYTVNVESWNGTSWSEGTNTSAAQGYGGAAGASSSNAMKFGGSGGPTGYSAITELWNGSSWTEIGNLSTSYAGNIGTGSSAAALNIPGKSAPSTYPGACEEFTGDITLQTITVS
jgi:hypothetical protein